MSMSGGPGKNTFLSTKNSPKKVSTFITSGGDLGGTMRHMSQSHTRRELLNASPNSPRKGIKVNFFSSHAVNPNPKSALAHLTSPHSSHINTSSLPDIQASEALLREM